MTTTEEAPEGAVGSGGEEGRTGRAGIGPEVSLALDLEVLFDELRNAGRAFDRWQDAGHPVEALPDTGAGAAFSPVLRLLAEIRTAPSVDLAGDLEARIRHALVPVVRSHVGLPWEGMSPEAGAQLFAAHLAPMVRDAAALRSPAFGIANDWAELHELVMARLMSWDDDRGPFALDLSERWLAEELLQRAQLWVVEGRAPLGCGEDVACVDWLARRLHWLPAPVEDGETHPVLAEEQALLLLLMDPTRVALEAAAAAAAAGAGDTQGPQACERPLAPPPGAPDHDDWTLPSEAAPPTP